MKSRMKGPATPCFFFTVCLLSACTTLGSLTEGPYRVERSSPVPVEIPDETARTEESVEATLVDILPGGALNFSVSHTFTAPVLRAESVQETRYYEDLLDRRGNVVGHRTWVGDYTFSCDGCGLAVERRPRQETVTVIRNQTPAGEVRRWERTPWPNLIRVYRESMHATTTLTGPEGLATFYLRPMVSNDTAPPRTPEIVLEIQSELAPTTYIRVDEALTPEEWFEIWGGLRLGEIEDQDLFNKQLQRRLTLLGYNTGGVDGVLGEETRAAARLYTRLCDSVPEGEISPMLLAHLSSRKACGYFDAYAALGIRDADNAESASVLLVYHSGGSYLAADGQWRPIRRMEPVRFDEDRDKSAAQLDWERRISESLNIDQEEADEGE